MRPEPKAIHTKRAAQELPYDNLQENTMIKVSVMYPNKPGARFDHDTTAPNTCRSLRAGWVRP